MPYRLNDLTREEMAIIRTRVEKKTQPDHLSCAVCGRSFVPKRQWQRFCSQKCRDAYNRERIVILSERLAQQQASWQAERDALILEIAELRREILELRAENR